MKFIEQFLFGAIVASYFGLIASMVLIAIACYADDVSYVRYAFGTCIVSSVFLITAGMLFVQVSESSDDQ